MAQEKVVGPQIKRKSGTGAPSETRNYVTPPAARKAGKGAPTPPVSKQFRRFGEPK